MIEYNSKNITLWSRLGTCGALGIAACDLAERMDNMVFLTADLCFYSGLDRFKQRFPDKLYNCGIAEENMIGMAAGFAKEGFITFASTYGTFASMRCADQVRVNMGYMGLPIKLIGLTSGLSVGILGATHTGNEDLAVMRAIPNIDVLSPADCMETIKAVESAALTNRPTYIRLTGSTMNPPVYKEDYEFEIGKAIELRKGNDISIIATGTMVYVAIKVAEALREDGIDVGVINMHTIKPLDQNAVIEATRAKKLVTLEEHSIIGGLGSAVNDCLATNRILKQCLNLGLSDEYKHAASYNYLLDSYGLTIENIATKVKNYYREE